MSEVNQIKDFVHDILINRFPTQREKQNVYSTKNGLNFACPFCGDSTKDPNKKRGNLFLLTNTFKCYNCGFYTSQRDFFFKMREMDYLDGGTIPLEYLKNSTYQKISENVKLGNLTFINFDLHEVLSKYGIDKTIFKEFFFLMEVEENTSILNYLKGRNILDHSNFLWDGGAKRLFILNMDKGTGKIIGYQTRQFGNTKTKYLNYKLSRMYEEFKKEVPVDEGFDKLDTLSIYFNILNVDLSQDIIYTEGAIDSSFFRNGISLGSVVNQPPFETPNSKYLLDFDKVGVKKSTELLKDKSFIFLWRKFLKKHKIPFREPIEGFKLDPNDVINYAFKNNIKLDWYSFFSNSSLDLLYL